jgi:glutamate/tyrosine decarboxylase-like PLP-dependent enzyme
LDRILELRKTYNFRIHVDAAYGGYFTLAKSLDPDARTSFDRLSQVDSIVVDPHKHGLQPYGCGCVLFRDPEVGALYKHDSPYTYFSSPELHLGEISLECSRAGAAAVALWATLQLLPLKQDGAFAADLDRCRHAARHLFSLLEDDQGFLTLFPPELDILVWAPRAAKTSTISTLARDQFERAEKNHLYLALVDIPADLARPWWPDVEFDTPTVTCLRSCLMKPEHEAWVERIWGILKEQRSEDRGQRSEIRGHRSES